MSVAGYALAEYIVAIALSYALIVITGFSEYIADYAKEKEWWRSVGIYSVLLVAGILLYSFEVRIGLVWMINGMLIMRCVTNVVAVIERW